MPIEPIGSSDVSNHVQIASPRPRGEVEALEGTVFAALIIPSVVALVLAAIQSLKWRGFSDPGFFAYMARLMDRWNFVPYVDFFDLNLPGIYLIHFLIGRILGYEYLSLRVADLSCLSGLIVITVFLMRGFGWKISLWSATAFGLYYISQYPHAAFALERDYFILLPISCAILVSWSRIGISDSVRSFLIGLLFGLSVTLRPLSVIAAPFFIVFQWTEQNPPVNDSYWSRPMITKLLILIASAGLGMVIPVIVMLSALHTKGALWPFMEIAANYWPLYASISADASGFCIVDRLHRLQLAFTAYFTFGGSTFLIVPAVLGSFIALFVSELDRSRKRRVLLLMSIAISFSICPVISSVPFSYRWIPFQYFAVLLGGLCLLPQKTAAGRWRMLFPAAILSFVLLYPTGMIFHRLWQYGISGGKLFGEPAEIGRLVDYLRTHAGPQDTVQPLDWFDCLAIQAMSLTRTKPATPFLYDLQFYHHVSNPYIINLRNKFLQDLQSASPRFIIKTQTVRIHGPDTTRDFPELSSFLEANYFVALVGARFTLYERVGLPPAKRPQ
jgi:hypothetical protein